jgi:hypothetical protein
VARTLTYTKPHKLSLLHDQLLAAGVNLVLVEGRGDDIMLTVADNQPEAAVDAVVAAHDASVLSLSEQAARNLDDARADLRDQYASAIDRLDGIVANGATYTAAQVRDAVVDLARILRAALKLLRQVM